MKAKTPEKVELRSQHLLIKRIWKLLDERLAELRADVRENTFALEHAVKWDSSEKMVRLARSDLTRSKNKLAEHEERIVEWATVLDVPHPLRKTK